MYRNRFPWKPAVNVQGGFTDGIDLKGKKGYRVSGMGIDVDG